MTEDQKAKIGKLLENVIQAEGLGNNTEIKFDNKGSDDGDGYISSNIAVEILTDEKVLLKLFVKTAPQDEKLRDKFFVKDLFAREIFFYEKIYPEFLKFQTERNVTEPFTGAPKCYATDDDDLNEAVVLEDLKDAGYVMYDKNVEMDGEHLAFIFKQLARFHAVSYAMKNQQPQLYEVLSTGWYPIIGGCLKNCGVHILFTHYIKELANIFDPVKDGYVLERIRGLPEMLMDTLDNMGQFSDACSVIAHGDCWYNNFMFKYEDTLVDVKILDWQALHLISPVLDLVHFFYGIATKETMSNLDSYMKLYHEVLSRNIEEMGSDPNVLYPYSVFEDHWKRFSRFGLMNSFGLQKMRLADQEDLVKINELIGKGKMIDEAFLHEIKKEELYRQRIKDVVRHFVDNDFI